MTGAGRGLSILIEGNLGPVLSADITRCAGVQRHLAAPCFLASPNCWILTPEAHGLALGATAPGHQHRRERVPYPADRIRSRSLHWNERRQRSWAEHVRLDGDRPESWLA